jgi:hypothetical protein
MHICQTNRIPLARIPDLNATAADEYDGQNSDHKPASAGRLIDQALSIKLLAAITLLLLGAAIIPLYSGKKNVAADSPSATAAPVTAWRPQSSSVSVDAATRPAQSPDGMPTQSPTTKPATLVTAMPERSAAPVAVPSPPEAQSQPPVVRSEELPRMSVWPNPDQSSVQQTDVRNSHDRTGSSLH